MKLTTIKKKLVITATLTAGLMAASTTTSSAAVSLTATGNADEWEIMFDPITFTANANTGNFAWIVFEDFYTADSNVRGAYVSGDIQFDIGGVVTSHTPTAANGTFDSTLGGIDQNDLFINLGGGATVNPVDGTTVIVSSASIRFTSTDVPVIASGPVNVAVWDNGDTAPIQTNEVSIAITTVPEPSSAALLGCVGLALLARRRRR